MNRKEPPMPSPFPGMNPYFERSNWREFHLLFIAQMRRWLGRQLSGQYIVRIEEDVYIHEASAEERRLTARADAAVVVDERPAPVSSSPAAVATPNPAFATLPDFAAEKQRWLAIRDKTGRDVLTVIELLSATNKMEHRERYEEKRLALVESGVNLVEIDLLRGGEHLPMEGLPACDYCVMVSRGGSRRVAVWPISMRDPLPKVPVPLREPDPDVVLDLQAMLHDLYDEASYGRDMSLYADPPDPPLSAEDQAWAEELLRGSRT